MSIRLCPECKGKARVVDSRPFADWVRRRYICANGHRYSSVDMLMPANISQQGRVTFRDRLQSQLRNEGMAQVITDRMQKQLARLLAKSLRELTESP